MENNAKPRKLKRLTLLTSILILCITFFDTAQGISNNSNSHSINFLSQPTGQYGVGFQDFHWINKNICPDPNFNGKNGADFSPDNQHHCREIIARIYYPTFQNESRAFYYPPLIKSLQENLSHIPNIPKNQIEELKQIKSFSTEKAPIITGKMFPVLLFSPGFGVPAESYENFITELVSQGYIVVAINSPFISGNVELPNAHVVKTASLKSPEDIINKFLPIQLQDLTYSFNQLRILHDSNAIFSAMNLNHIGALGHSLGAMAVAEASRIHSTWFQAAATLDIGVNDTTKIIQKMKIPFLYILSAKSFQLMPVKFELGENGYLVVLAKGDQDHEYSYHMNLSDLSTLQYLPAFQTSLNYAKQQRYTLKLMSHEPTAKDSKNFRKETIVLVKDKNNWSFLYYHDSLRLNNMNANRIKGLEEDLNNLNLPKKPLEQLSPSEIASVEKVIKTFFPSYALTVPFGTGDGWEITHSINTYLVQFFNTFLKNENNIAFKNCNALSRNTFIKCGPGIF